MQVTVGVVVDCLKDNGIEVLSASRARNVAFTDVTLVSLASPHTATAGWLHVGSADEAEEFLKTYYDAFLVCCCAGPEAPAELLPFRDRIIFAQEPCQINDVYMLLRDWFFQLNLWEDSVNAALLENADYQRIVDLSEGILGNFISISDSQFRLLAYSKGIEVDDPVSNSLVELGHHTPETIQLFRSLKLMERWHEDGRYLEVCDESPVCTSPTISHVFRYRQSYFVHAVMLCNNRPITDGLKDLFHSFCVALAHCVKRDWETRQHFTQPHDLFFQELSRGGVISPGDARGRAELLHIPVTGNFTLYSITIDNSDELEREQVASELARQFPRALVSLMGERLLFVMVEPQAPCFESSPDVGMLERSFAGNIACTVGVSNVFHSWEKFFMALLQADFAHDCIHVSLMAERDRIMKIRRFGDLLCTYILDPERRNDALDRYSLSQHPLWKMHLDDTNRNTDNMHLLTVYLECERRSTCAAERLNMHRNSVTYRIDRIVNQYGLDLDDPHKRFELQLVSTILRTNPNAVA